METNRAAIIEKIQKILALAEREAGNETEAMTAMGMVHALLAKYNLSLDDVTVTDDAADLGAMEMDEGIGLKRGTGTWVSILYQGVAQLNFCDVFTRPGRRGGQAHLCIVGRQANVAVVKAVGSYLVATAERLSSEQSRMEEDRRSWRAAFHLGFARRIRERALADLYRARRGEMRDEATGQALVLVGAYDHARQDIQAHLRAQGVRLRNTTVHSRTRSADGYQAGQAAGSQASYSRNGVGSGKGRLALN